nr:uncharacterized protein LOC105850582 [Hydra vulgaris]
MYIKLSVSFRGGYLIGYSEDNPTKIAKTLLVFMIKPMFGKPSFVCRIVPIFKLSVHFLHDLIININKQIIDAGGKLLCLLSDNHPTNRSVYQNFVVNKSFPWQGVIEKEKPVIMLHDPVHLFKSLRNNWFTEKTQTISLKINNQPLSGDWSHIVQLYNRQKTCVAKTTKLSRKSVYPSLIDRQNVANMVAVFNEKTVAALRLANFENTACFLAPIVSLWNMLNVHSDCCTMDLMEEDIIYLDECLINADNESINDQENAALFYILVMQRIVDTTTSQSASSEFTDYVSRGKLRYPGDTLLQFICVCYLLFNSVPMSGKRFQCVVYLKKLFLFLHSTLPFDLETDSIGISKVISIITNCFLKGVTTLDNTSDIVSLNIEDRKRNSILSGLII